MSLLAGQLAEIPGIGHNGGPPIWEPQEGPQALAIGAPFVGELLFGGARGGGKSDFLLGDFAQDIHIGVTWRGIIFRKSFPELEELILRAKEIYYPMGAQYKVADKTFVFPSGATLKFRFIENEGDADLYQGHQYGWIGWDELGNWPNLNAYKKLKACLRSAHPIKNKRIRASANPGGIGHHSVRNYFIDPAPLGLELINNVDDDGTVTTRMFIPSRVYDNKLLLLNDPTYISRLREIGSPELVRAWLEGDWNVITGAYFPEFSTSKHVLEPFEIPKHWMRFRSMDWGSSKPFSVHWHAVSDGFFTPSGMFIPSGAIVTYREWYGCVVGKVNEGVKMNARQVGIGIADREKNETISYGVIDPSAFKWDGGPSHAERMAEVGAYFRKADNNRIGGWDTVRDRLCGEDGDPDVAYGVGTPMWYVFKQCTHLIRTLPALQHDLNNPEDCDTAGEDHAPDDLRYGLMSRPWTRVKKKSSEAGRIKLLQDATFDEIWADHEQYANNRGYN
jgi:Terminase large subunit, T4likevirus-type, N-terminal